MIVQPTISVVLAVFNGERHLEASLRSVVGQSFADFELIVVDDGSTDGTPDILADVQRADSRVVLVRQENRGLTPSLIRGVALAVVKGPRRYARIRAASRCLRLGACCLSRVLGCFIPCGLVDWCGLNSRGR